MGWYQVEDYWTTSSMERVCNAYRNAIDDIDDYLYKIDVVLAWMPAEADLIFRNLEALDISDASDGDFVHEFNGKLSVVSQEMRCLYQVGDIGSDGRWRLQAKRNELARRLTILENLCAKEDEQEEEIPLSDIRF